MLLKPQELNIMAARQHNEVKWRMEVLHALETFRPSNNTPDLIRIQYMYSLLLKHTKSLLSQVLLQLRGDSRGYWSHRTKQERHIEVHKIDRQRQYCFLRVSYSRRWRVETPMHINKIEEEQSTTEYEVMNVSRF